MKRLQNISPITVLLSQNPIQRESSFALFLVVHACLVVSAILHLTVLVAPRQTHLHTGPRLRDLVLAYHELQADLAHKMSDEHVLCIFIILQMQGSPSVGGHDFRRPGQAC